MIFEHTEIGNGARHLELAVVGGGHGRVDADEAGGEDEEDAERAGELPSSEGEPLQFGPLSGGRIVVLLRPRALFVPQQPPALAHQIPRSRH